jgi:type IV pilus assembly protein PilB
LECQDGSCSTPSGAGLVADLGPRPVRGCVMDPHLRAFLLVTAFLVALVVAIVLVRRMLRGRQAGATPTPADTVSRDDTRPTATPVAGSDARGAREWRRLATGVPRLLELLVSDGTLTADQAQQAALEQRKTGEGVGPVLTQLGLLTEDQLFSWLSHRYGIPIVNLESLDVPEGTLTLVRREIAQRYHVFPVRRVDDTLTLALSDPTSLSVIDDIQFATGLRVAPVLAPAAAIRASLVRHYHDDYQAKIDALFKNDQQLDVDSLVVIDRSRKHDITELEEGVEQAPVIRLVNLILADAIAKHASDIHLEPGEDSFNVRYRIDGVLHDAILPPKQLEAAILSRVKIMSRMDIAERRLPQDGRITVRLAQGEIDLRVSSLPTIFGESIVLRILDKSRVVLDLVQLGFEDDDLERLRRIIRSPHGMILVTGPTGSGKSTTLYAAVSTINKPEINILTAEDPVEYKLPRIKQVHVRDDIGLSFEMALRAFLRQDPDVILVGEMRDTETAQIAIRAALTGHLVFSTLHTNDAPSTVTRLLDMGVAPFLVTSSLLLVVAQRLCRKICPECREPTTVSMGALLDIGFKPEDAGKLTLQAGRGCSNCAGTGYRGRTVVAEFLEITPELQEAVVQRRSVRDIRDIAVAQGMRSLREAGLRKVAAGITTVEEMIRITYAH